MADLTLIITFTHETIPLSDVELECITDIQLVDELVDAGYTIERIIMEIIYETLVVSGVISEEDLENIKSEKEKINNMTEEEKKELIAKRKNLQK